MRYFLGSLLWGCLLLFGVTINALAADVYLTPEDDLQLALDSAGPEDRLFLGEGLYRGNFVIPDGVEIDGQSVAVIDAGGLGHGLRIIGKNVRVSGLRIQNWGDDLSVMDAGIFVEKTANGVQIIDNNLRGDSFGIWLDGISNAQVIGNRVEGNAALRSTDRGNGIHLSSVTGTLIKGNEVWHARDGLYIESSNNNRLIGNYLHDLRYGIHYMYSYSNEVYENLTRNTRTGYALMQSKYLTVKYNRSENDRNYGILLNYITYSTIAHNRVEGVQSGLGSKLSAKSRPVSGAEGKAIFIYNSLFNQVTNNLLASSDLGIHLTAGSEQNRFSANAFISNKEQVKYVANRQQEWSHQGQGNYWSDYVGWDMNDDGIGDTIYEPNDGIDKLLWKYPAARILLNSPAVELLRWVQRQFPIFKSPGVSDSNPLMHSPYLSSTP